MKGKKRYESVSYGKVKGIRKDINAGTFYVEKYISGERFSATFKDIKKAANWKKNFYPGLSNSTEKVKSQVKSKARDKMANANVRKRRLRNNNGHDLGLTFSDVWESYKEKHLMNLELSTIERRECEVNFYKEIMFTKMIHFNADLISSHIELKKKQYLKNPSGRRYSFDQDLKYLKAVFNWYRENIDEMFINPVLKRHKKEGFIRKMQKKKKKMKKHELLTFFDALESDDLFWRDVAECQFYFTSRIQEVGGLLLTSIDFSEDIVDIENVSVWGRNKKFRYLKDRPKNNEDRVVVMNKSLRNILLRRKNDVPDVPWQICPVSGVVLELAFHINGKPLDYRQVQYRYNKALIKAGLDHKFSATHIMRHSMANLVRSSMGLDSAQAVGGWKSRKVVESIYTDVPTHLSSKALKSVECSLLEERENHVQRRLHVINDS